MKERNPGQGGQREQKGNKSCFFKRCFLAWSYASLQGLSPVLFPKTCVPSDHPVPVLLFLKHTP